MKVKVRIIKSPYTDVPTKSLEAILRNHAHDNLPIKINSDQLYGIMDVLVERREASGYQFKSDEEALAEFKQHYMQAERKPPRYDYAGGFDHCLLELSEVLPVSAYSKKNINEKK